MSAKILFVCVENSCRSQMAEGFARMLGLEGWSAGSKPSGRINPTAIEVMKERNIDISAGISKRFSTLPDVAWDYVVGMGCGDDCPFIRAKVRLDWDIPDPKNMPLEGFREVRDEIERKVWKLQRAIELKSRKEQPKKKP